MKFKNGDQCYLDILGRTNKNKTLTVTIVKKKLFGHYIVISDQTKEVFSINKKHLTPINPNNENQFFIRKTNPLMSFDIVDYSLLKNTMKAINTLYDDYLSKMPNYKTYDMLIKEVKKSINVILSKMSIILKNEEEHEVVKNLIDRDYRSELSIIEDLSNNSSSNKPSISYKYTDGNIKDILMNFMIEFRSIFTDPYDIYGIMIPSNDCLSSCKLLNILLDLSSISHLVTRIKSCE